MRVSLLLTLLVLLSLVAVSVHGLPEEATHVDPIEEHELDLDIQQPTGAPTRTPGATPTPTRPASRTTPPATRPRTTRTPRTSFPTTRPTREGLISPLTGRPRRLIDPLRMEPEMGVDLDMSRLSRLERRLLRRMFRRMFLERMREMFGADYPMSPWEMRVIRMIALRDLMMNLDVQAQEAAQLASEMEGRDAEINEEGERETYDDTTEIEAEPELETEHETEAMPEDTLVEHELDDPTMIESEFDISAPYGGYGGFGGYGYGGYGYGSKKGYGGYKKAPPKKQPYKKVPYKKVPYKKVPYKKGYGGYGYGGY